jgi:hypothetical protein
MTEHPLCQECHKEIWGISHIQLTMGVEEPTLLHSVCWERLKEFEYMYKDLCDET